jgi:hypothetical protein
MKITKLLVTIICVLLVTAFCIIAVSGKIFTLQELPMNFMVVFLGAIVTAMVTLILLNGQSMAEEVKDKNIKVFEKKSLLFEKFISKLFSIVISQKFTANDYISIIRSEYYSKLMLYLKEKSQRDIITYLVNLSNCVSNPIDDYTIDLKAANNDYHEAIRENIYKIINILAAEIKLGGKTNTKFQKQLDYAVFPKLFQEVLRKEMNRIFLKEGIFNKAFYQVMAYGTFLVLNLNGKFTNTGGIHIGPFFNATANEEFPPYDGINFRFFLPMLNPLSKPYAVNDRTNYTKTLADFQCSNNGLIDLQMPPMLTILDGKNIYNNINNKKFQKIRFDDVKALIENYTGIFADVAKAIALRSFHYYATAKTKQDGLTIKELFDKFEGVTTEQYIDHMIKTLMTPIDFSK